MTISHSETITKLMGALLKVQGEVDGVAKDSTNPHFRAKYASLEAVHEALRGPLQDAGLVVMQAPGEVFDATGAIALTTMVVHAASGEWIKSTMHLPLAKNDPQGAGSAITYAERYSLMALFCLPAVDDDGEAAQRPAQRQQPVRAYEYQPKREARPAQAEASPDGIRVRMLAALQGAASIHALERLTGQESWKAMLAGLPEAHRVTIAASAVKRHEDLSKVPA